MANLAAVRRRVGPGVRVEPVVKADAYGHGSVPIALALDAAGVDGLSVATFDEALELRDAGVRAPILVLYPVPPDRLGEAVERSITLNLSDPELVRRTLSAPHHDGPPLALHLEVETGLGRGGVAPEALVAVARAIGEADGVRLAGTWSHLAAPGDRARTDEQVRRFETALANLHSAGIDPGIRHLAATGGIIAGIPWYDAVRPGLSVYGLVPDDADPDGEARSFLAALRPVLSLRARPIRVADLPAGAGISYGPSFETRHPSRIATLPLGYGDGWARALSNRAEALVRGIRVPIVGTVAMDAVMADVTDVPGLPVTVDDEFVLIGSDGLERIGVADVARARTTISWEVVTSMARRLPRVYHAAGSIIAIRTLTELETE